VLCGSTSASASCVICEQVWREVALAKVRTRAAWVTLNGLTVAHIWFSSRSLPGRFAGWTDLQ